VEQGHGKHGQMERMHYRMLLLNIVVSTAIMYLLMFEMIWSGPEFFNNLNMLYMALTMAMPMGILMLLLMGSMYQNRRLNGVLYALFALLFAFAFWGVRAQVAIGDRQFVRSMIPHHAGAILMCNRAPIRDAEIRQLCFGPNGIVQSQTREIKQMEGILARI
jgi:uncharacterized protein (DUF305 family)